MEIPGLGKVEKDARFHWYVSGPIAVPLLGGKLCNIIVDKEYDQEDGRANFRAAIVNFFSATQAVLRAVEIDVFHYY